MILASILSTACVFAAQQGPAVQIYCKAVISDSSCLLGSPAVRDLSGEKAVIRTDSLTSHLTFEITPTMNHDGKIHNAVRVQISDRKSSHQEGSDIDESHSTDVTFVYAARHGKQTRVIFGQKGAKVLKEKEKSHLSKGEFELDLTVSISGPSP